MPILDWIGKEAVVNHHRDVPFRLLTRDPSSAPGQILETFVFQELKRQAGRLEHSDACR